MTTLITNTWMDSWMMLAIVAGVALFILLLLAGLIAAAARGSRYEEQLLEEHEMWMDDLVDHINSTPLGVLPYYENTPIYYQLLAESARNRYPKLAETWRIQ